MDQYGPTTEEQGWNPFEPEKRSKILLPGKVSELRRKLGRKARQEPQFRFYALYDRIYRLDVLQTAWKIARSNDGKPGVDGVSFKMIERSDDGVDGFLREIQESLRSKTYRPSAVLRAMISKLDGGERPLGIPTIRDRVIQTATLLILEPIFEEDFEDCSYGFRPQRSAHDALSEIRDHLNAGFRAVYDADLKGYFDSIPHDNLMAAVDHRVSDGSVLQLIRMWLSAPVEEPGEKGRGMRRTHPKAGTPQGGVISPLLANLYLHWFDRTFHQSSGPGHWANARLVRYADDFVVMARYCGDRLTGWIEDLLEGRFGLTINRTKTSVVDLNEKGASLDFLGFRFRYDQDLYGRGHRYLNIVPSPKAMKRVREKIREATSSRKCYISLTDTIDGLNQQLRGWKNYFKFGYPRACFRKVNHYVRVRLGKQVRRRSQRGRLTLKNESAYSFLERMGLIYL